jgi:hypothetical protein
VADGRWWIIKELELRYLNMQDLPGSVEPHIARQGGDFIRMALEHASPFAG